MASCTARRAQSRALPFLLLPLLLAAPASADTSIDADVEACHADPRFRVGGAAIGDCLMELSEAADRQIAAAIAEGSQRYCFEEDRADYLQSHADWTAYRTRMCDLVERSPGNTPSWINAAACRLELGRQRLASLKYANEYGSPRCPVK